MKVEYWCEDSVVLPGRCRGCRFKAKFVLPSGKKVCGTHKRYFDHKVRMGFAKGEAVPIKEPVHA